MVFSCESPLNLPLCNPLLPFVSLLASSGSRQTPALSTPLHCAAVSGQLPVARELLSRGHEPTPTDKNGHMPIFYARVKKHAEVVALLAKALVHHHTSQQQMFSRSDLAVPFRGCLSTSQETCTLTGLNVSFPHLCRSSTNIHEPLDSEEDADC